MYVTTYIHLRRTPVLREIRSNIDEDVLYDLNDCFGEIMVACDELVQFVEDYNIQPDLSSVQLGMYRQAEKILNSWNL